MKIQFKNTAAALLVSILFTTSLFAKTGSEKAGVGIILGNPTGLSLKFADSGNTHFNAGLAWSFQKESNLHIHADYIFKHFKPVHFSGNFSVTPTMGIGGQLQTKDTELGVRVPFGLAYEFKENPFDFFIEIVPALNLIPATDFEIGAAIALRYLF